MSHPEDTHPRPRRSPTPVPVRRSIGAISASAGAWRRLRGLTQVQLAERAGVSAKTIVNLESGAGGIGLESLLRVARVLGILDQVVKAFDPYETDLGRLRADEQLPQRVRPKAR